MRSVFMTARASVRRSAGKPCWRIPCDGLISDVGNRRNRMNQCPWKNTLEYKNTKQDLMCFFLGISIIIILCFLLSCYHLILLNDLWSILYYRIIRHNSPCCASSFVDNVAQTFFISHRILHHNKTIVCLNRDGERWRERQWKEDTWTESQRDGVRHRETRVMQRQRHNNTEREI